jgi:hypothetical protein
MNRRPRAPHEDRQHEDKGAVLILAISFVVMIGAIAAGMASLVITSMNNRGTLERVRDREYAADGAIEDAIVKVRALAATGTDACQTVSGVSSTTGLNTFDIRVDWRNACGVVRSPDGVVLVQRDAIFAACVDTGIACTETTTIIRAQVNFEQAATGVVTRTYVQSWSVNQ